MKYSFKGGFAEATETFFELSPATGIGLGGLVESALATTETIKARKKEKISAKTRGLAGSSRTKANKEVTKIWSGAVSGSAASLMGAAVGQVS